MTSLSETYGGRGRSEVDPRRLYLGVGLFAAGTLLLVAGILTAAEVLASGRYTSGEARLYGGILGGIGVPLLTLGVMSVLPADRATRSAAVVGAAVMLLGVALFAHAYPHQWVGGPSPELTDLTLPTAGVYFLGAATAFWCLFVGVANFKTRNDPGGTVTMEVTHKGETKVIEVERGQLDGVGGVGLLGGTPDGDVETQTNRSGDGSTSDPTRSTDAAGGTDHARSTDAERGAATDGRTTSNASASKRAATSSRGARSQGSRSSPGVAAGTSDGGTATDDISSPLDAPSSPGNATDRPSTDPNASPREGPGDKYCGNCAQFDYVRTDEGMRPYCGHYDELMDDMDACDQWTPR